LQPVSTLSDRNNIAAATDTYVSRMIHSSGQLSLPSLRGGNRVPALGLGGVCSLVSGGR